MKAGFILALVATSGATFVMARPHFAQTRALRWTCGIGHVDLGVAPLSRPLVARFSLHNVSEDAVAITHVELQCGCHGLGIEVDGAAVGAPQEGFTVPAGAEARISLGFRPLPGRRQYGVLLDDASGNRYQALATCDGAADHEVDPPELALGRLLPGSATTVEFTVRSPFGVPFLLADHDLLPEGRHGLVEMVDVQLGGVRMRGTFVAPMEAGRFGISAELRDQVGRTVRVPCSGEVDPRVEVRPGRVQVVQGSEGQARFALSWDPGTVLVARSDDACVRTDSSWLEARTVTGEGSCIVEATWRGDEGSAEDRVGVLHVRIPELFRYQVALALVTRGSR